MKNKAHHYNSNLTELDLILFVKLIDRCNVYSIINLLLEHNITMDEFYYTIVIEKKIAIDEIKFKKCKDNISLIFELMELEWMK